MSKQFNKGDIVRVINDGQTYNGYRAWAVAQNLENWVSGAMPVKGGEYIVVVVAEHETKGYDTLVGIVNESGQTFIVSVRGLQLVRLGFDLTQPVFTAEGTPVQIITTQGRDPKFPVLGYEGNATILSKFSLEGKNKNGVERRHLTNVQAPEPKLDEREFFINLYDGIGNVGTPVTGSNIYPTLKVAKSAAELGILSDKHAGIAKVTLVSGRFPKGK